MSTKPAVPAYTNALYQQTSPYLLQHAHNPVEWFPWCEQALERARREDKPILLSIGYSACHWCHVMAHESFEDLETAALMNDLFINIKVDREERPDLDKIYQNAHYLLTQRGGGWPLTMFLSPDDQTPFFGGTYFPPEPRHGLPSFKDLLQRVAAFYRQQREAIQTQNESLRTALSQTLPTTASTLTAAPLTSARSELERAYDTRHGGFGKAPKFPHPTNIERLLRHWAARANAGEPDEMALDMARMTLHAMASGGIYDQIGGGFCRYSVDDQWMIPHFEKMLYDNGPLLALYAEAWLACGDPVFARVARETADWVIREMQAPDGGYYSTLDADSEGEEGKFYAWTPDEVRRRVDEHEYAVVARYYGFDRSANFEGKWHPQVCVGLDRVAKELALDPDGAGALLTSARARLFAARETRVRPGRDEKILTSWNGLMIRGMAAAGRYLRRPEYVESAAHALDFVRDTLWRDGRLLATYKDGRAHLAAYLDDYVFLIGGILELLQARWREEDLGFALKLADVVLERFQDPSGGFFFTADDHEPLIHRPKPLMDEATPAGNGLAAWTLGRLGHLLGDSRLLMAAEHTLLAAWSSIIELPYAHSTLLNALEEHLDPPQTIVLRGAKDDLGPWAARCARHYAPRRVSFAIPDDVHELPGGLAQRMPRDGVVAYVCTGHSCSEPIASLEALERVLQKTEATTAS